MYDFFPVDVRLQWGEDIKSKAFPMQLYIEEVHDYPGGQFPLHWHKAAELTAVLQGDVLFQIGGQALTLAPGDGLFLNSNVLHSFSARNTGAPCRCASIIFSSDFIAPVTSVLHTSYVSPLIGNASVPFVLFRPGNNWQGQLLQHLSNIFSLLYSHQRPTHFQGAYPERLLFPPTESSCYEIDVHIEMLRLWKLFFSHAEELPAQKYDPQALRTQQRMQQMLAYIHENYMRRITLADIASAAHIGKSEASRCFQACVGAAPVAYLLQHRILMATEYLSNTSLSISEICGLCGFQSPSYFAKQYRLQTGRTPSAARGRGRFV